MAENEALTTANRTLSTRSADLEARLEQLEAYYAASRAKQPDVEALVDAIVAEERAEHERKSRKVLEILAAKDASLGAADDAVAELKARLDTAVAALHRQDGDMRQLRERSEAWRLREAALLARIAELEDDNGELEARLRDAELALESAVEDGGASNQAAETHSQELLGQLAAKDDLVQALRNRVAGLEADLSDARSRGGVAAMSASEPLLVDHVGDLQAMLRTAADARDASEAHLRAKDREFAEAEARFRHNMEEMAALISDGEADAEARSLIVSQQRLIADLHITVSRLQTALNLAATPTVAAVRLEKWGGGKGGGRVVPMLSSFF